MIEARYDPASGDGFITLICFLTFAAIALNGLRIYKFGRIQIFHTLKEILMSPFGLV